MRILYMRVVENPKRHSQLPESPDMLLPLIFNPPPLGVCRGFGGYNYMGQNGESNGKWNMNCKQPKPYRKVADEPAGR